MAAIAAVRMPSSEDMGVAYPLGVGVNRAGLVGPWDGLRSAERSSACVAAVRGVPSGRSQECGALFRLRDGGAWCPFGTVSGVRFAHSCPFEGDVSVS